MKKIFEIEYEYPWSVSADWLMRLFNSPKVKSIKEIKSKQMSVTEIQIEILGFFHSGKEIDRVLSGKNKGYEFVEVMKDLATAIHKEQGKKLGENK